ncbi:ANTAR domain-containing response regulator [Caldicellulosiruptoraceae bacterium PP1]
MSNLKFVLVGEDKKILGLVKRLLTSHNNIFVGYTTKPYELLRLLRSCCPELVIIDIGNKLGEFKSILRIIDEDLLSACILIIERKNDDIMEFITSSRIITFTSKLIYEETFIQLIDISMLNYKRILDYEKRLNELSRRLEERRIIEKAKWLLVKNYNLTEEQAYEFIQKRSREKRISMGEMAKNILSNYELNGEDNR